MRFQISIPSTMHLDLQNENFIVTGPLGSQGIPRHTLDPKGLFLFRIENDQLHVQSQAKTRPSILNAYRGSLQSSFEKTFQTLSQGILLQLELVGVGFRVEQSGQNLEFKLGFSHPIMYELPSDVRAIVPKPTHFLLYGVDPTRVTQVGAEIKRLRPPEMYKGKGIRRSSDVLYLKVKK